MACYRSIRPQINLLCLFPFIFVCFDNANNNHNSPLKLLTSEQHHKSTRVRLGVASASESALAADKLLGTYSRLIAEIHFARRMGYYLIQIYIPSSLIVVISWVSFWLHRNASPARVQLGVTTVLTMTTLMSSTNAALPKISYVKSIDIFLGTCFVMVFAALLEYATVGYLGKRIAMRKAQVQHAQSQAQARAFAQLQAQGAHGDPVPPNAAAAAADAAAASTSAINQQQLFSPDAVTPKAIQQHQQDHQQALMQQLLFEAGDLGGGRRMDATNCSEPQVPPQVPERSHCNHCHANRTHSQSRSTAGCHAHTLDTSSHCWCAAHETSKTTTISRHRKSCCNRHGGGTSRDHLSTSSLPRSCHDKCQPPPVPPPPPPLSLGLDYPATCPQQQQQPNQDFHQPRQQQQPPSYCSKAAAAAAATFVNMHRKNKGLPPSSNPNFVQYNQWQSSLSNRSLETIFGVRPSDIDKYSRVVFPVCFVCFQLMYWIVYLHISAFLETEYQQNSDQASTQPPLIPTTQAPLLMQSLQPISS